MQISASTAQGGSQAQRLLSALLQQQPETSGQSQSTKDTQGRPSGPPPGGPPPGPPPGGGARQFASSTLGSLLSTQESSSDNPIDALIGEADSDSDGLLSLDEIKSTLGADASDQLSAAVSALDTDSDGKLSSAELSAGLEAKRAAGGRPPPPSNDEVATRLISDVDQNDDGALSQDEVKSKLGIDEAADDAFSSAFGRLDTDGDGQLGLAELTSALEAFQSNRGRGQAASSAITA